jgi:hypothetical protein
MKKDRTKPSLPTTVFASEGASLGQLVLRFGGWTPVPPLG